MDKKTTAQEAQKLVKESKAILIDVRNPFELTSYSVSFAKNIPLSELEEHLSELPKDTLIITTCSSGHRAETACEILTKNGFTAQYVAEPMVAFKDIGE